MNVQMRVYVLRTFVTHLLVHMHQKEKIALEIAAKIASVNRPFSFLSNSCFGRLGSLRAGPPREDCSRLGKQFADWDTMIYRLPDNWARGVFHIISLDWQWKQRKTERDHVDRKLDRI
jgi:hypothetical protein